MASHDDFSNPIVGYSADGAGVLADTALRAAEPNPLDPAIPLYAIITPPQSKLEVIDIEERLAQHKQAPARATGTHTAATVQSFVDIVHRHDVAGDTLTVWVHPVSGDVIAVLNDHGRDQDPQWGDHRVKLTLLPTEEWKRWKSLDGQLSSQEKFAEHIQDGITEIAEPPAADLLEIVQTMQGSTNATWKAGSRLVDGAVQMEYSEDITATAGRNSQLSIPTKFLLVLAPFIGENVVQLEANLRWRVAREGKLTIGYKLQNPELVIRQALEKVADRLRDEFPNRVYIGIPR